MGLPSTTTIYGKTASKSVTNIISNKLVKVTGLACARSSDHARGYFIKMTGLDLIKENIKQLIRTRKGERFMLPDYGCDVRNYLMEPLDEYTFNEVKTSIEHNIRKYLGRVVINRIQVFETDSQAMNIKLFCSFRENDAVNFEIGFAV